MKPLLCCLLLCFTTVGFAEANEAAKASKAVQERQDKQPTKLTTKELKSLQEKLSGKKYLTIEFEQIVFGGLRGKKRRSEGKARLALPGSFLWELEKPMQEQMYFDGKDFIQYRPTQKVATKFPSGNEKSREISDLVSLVLDFDKLLETYTVQESQKTGTAVSLALRPKSKNNLEAVELKVDTAKGYVTWLKLLYSTGGYTEWDFDNPSWDKIPENVFKFAPPPGVRFSTL